MLVRLWQLITQTYVGRIAIALFVLCALVFGAFVVWYAIYAIGMVLFVAVTGDQFSVIERISAGIALLLLLASVIFVASLIVYNSLLDKVEIKNG